MSQHLSANIRKLYILRFFHSLIPAYVIERLYWEQRGMSIQEVVYTEIIYAVTIVLLEVPLGIAADKWGRKNLLILDAVLACFEFLLLLFATEFWHFALIVCLAGVGRSASSGAEDALLYDTLEAQGAGQERRFEQLLGRLRACDISATIIAALCGSLLASRFELELNYWLSLGATLVSFIFTLALREPPRAAAEDPRSEAEGEQSAASTTYLRAAVKFFAVNPSVCLVVLSGMVLGVSVTFVEEFWQTYLDRAGIPVLWFGLFSAGIFLLQLPGSLLAHALVGRARYRTIITAVLIVFAIGFACLSATTAAPAAGLAAIGLICLAAGMTEPLVTGYVQHRAPSRVRATIGSFQSFGENAAMVIVGMGFGYFSMKHDIYGGFGTLAVLCGAFLVWFYAASRRRMDD
jgi:MFS family permease